MLPGHFFCRFDDGVNQCNIEPNLSGINHPNSYYLNAYSLGNKSWYNLKSLSKIQTIGILCFNAGTVCLANKNYSKALAYFSESIRRVPQFVEAKGNLAISYAQSGNLGESKLVFDTLIALYPDLKGLAGNYGAVLLRLAATHQ
jgi:tetratricopeptide (TPR) repeat protein